MRKSIDFLKMIFPIQIVEAHPGIESLNISTKGLSLYPSRVKTEDMTQPIYKFAPSKFRGQPNFKGNQIYKFKDMDRSFLLETEAGSINYNNITMASLSS